MQRSILVGIHSYLISSRLGCKYINIDYRTRTHTQLYHIYFVSLKFLKNLDLEFDKNLQLYEYVLIDVSMSLVGGRKGVN